MNLLTRLVTEVPYGPRVGQIDPQKEKIGVLFRSDFRAFWLNEPGFFPFKANLGHLGHKSDITGLKTKILKFVYQTT